MIPAVHIIRPLAVRALWRKKTFIALEHVLGQFPSENQFLAGEGGVINRATWGCCSAWCSAHNP